MTVGARAGDEWWLRWHRWLDSGATGLYLLLTTAAGLQTLGEEYAGIVQVVGRRRLPGTLVSEGHARRAVWTAGLVGTVWWLLIDRDVGLAVMVIVTNYFLALGKLYDRNRGSIMGVYYE